MLVGLLFQILSLITEIQFKKKKEKQKHGNGRVDQWAKIGNLSMNTCNYSPLILTKMPKVHARGQIASSNGTKKAGCPDVEEQN